MGMRAKKGFPYHLSWHILLCTTRRFGLLLCEPSGSCWVEAAWDIPSHPPFPGCGHVPSTEPSLMWGMMHEPEQSWHWAPGDCNSLRNCWDAAKLDPLKASFLTLLPGEQLSFKYFWVLETITLWNPLSPFTRCYTRWAAARLLCAYAYNVWSINYPIKQKTGSSLPKNQLQAKLNFVFSQKARLGNAKRKFDMKLHANKWRSY